MAQDRGDTVNDEARKAQGTLGKECGFALLRCEARHLARSDERWQRGASLDQRRYDGEEYVAAVASTH
ncbi:hypothetical protein CUJ84_pRLN3000410 (plasmid) [Rhizobium leguminosarum]|uniref:Uncharacterized protein n=1 Tax=Rhizobium leguminosarum TaxID=384 RepID=A0A2K9ZH65_RHILE|nr:hypothetical protein CUJ84_pRLN3000410 [Rhizobium leguminosarum]